MGEYYSKFGFSGSNTYFTFKTDGTFAAKIDGKSWQGNYTFDEKTHAIQMKGLILSMSGYATKTANGISLLFDQKKLLNLIKTIGSLKGNSTLSAIGTIANNYDGMRVGFEMTRRIEGVNQDKAHLNEILRTPFDFCVPTISFHA